MKNNTRAATLDALEIEIQDKLKNWKDVIAQYQEPNKKKAILQLFTTFLPYLTLWVLMYFAWSYSIILTIALGLVNSFFLVRIFIIQHDCGHQSFLGSKKWNNAIGTVCSLFSTIPFKYLSLIHI